MRLWRLAALLGGLLLACAACLPDPQTVAAGKRILVVGDSLAVEAEQAFEAGSGDGEAFYGLTVDWLVYGGIAPCDVLGKVQAEAERFRPTNTVFAFTGNHLTACMAGRADTLTDMVNAYVADYQTLVTLIGRGHFAWLVSPMSRPNVEARAAVGCGEGADVLASDAPCPAVGTSPVIGYEWHGDAAIGAADCLLGVQVGRCDTRAREILGDDWSSRLSDGVHLDSLHADTYARAILAATEDQ